VHLSDARKHVFSKLDCAAMDFVIYATYANFLSGTVSVVIFGFDDNEDT